MKKQRSGYESGNLTPLNTVFSSVYARKQWQRQWRLFALVQDWPRLVGPEISRLTRPAFFRRDTLWLHVQDSVWMHHLQFIKPDLIARVNQGLPEHPIVDLRWQLDPLPPLCPPPPRPDQLPLDREQEHAFYRMTESISNLECREALQGLWRTLSARFE